MNDSIVTIIVAGISAFGASGAVGYFFKWLQDQPANKAHQNKAWTEWRDKALKDADEKAEDQDEHIQLCEYKIDRLIENYDILLGELQTLGAPAARIAEERSKLRQLRFLKEIPSPPPNDQF